MHSGWVSNNLEAQRAKKKTATVERPAAPGKMTLGISVEVRGKCHTAVLIIAVGVKI